MAETTIVGQVLEDFQERDAIHVAVASVIADADRLYPSERVGFTKPGNVQSVGVVENVVGIVDPFLLRPVYRGDIFWMFLFPQTITSLKHNWTHPAFAPQVKNEFEGEQSDRSESERWLREFAANYGESYDRMLQAAEDFVTHGEYFNRGDKFEGEWVPDEFWTHYTRVTGKSVGGGGSFFTCSC